MKKILILLVFSLGITNHTNSQVIDDEQKQTPQELYEFHIAKKKTNSTAGWIALAGGVGMIAGGMAINIDECLLSDCKNGMPLVYFGVGVGITSFVLFNKASQHNKKAKVHLQRGAVGINYDIPYNGLSFTFTF
ncbi:hypothetical protein [Winogradskyella vincentii]|uniref:DUF4134 domain-containing protein n=1 Tax=Winogradskyella vincentii TaxID=2877122 RepID=A0ABS7Y2X4_9FLAO|nr:hypothetical protein [Winogradskyella vincentii]MCA0152972.1 hypothetical protein [Winogradskyella vincentii]